MRPKGLPKTGGRQRGVLNKTTAETKAIIQLFIFNNLSRLQEDFDSVEPKDRLIIFERLLKYVVPTKIEEITTEEDMQEQVIINIGGNKIDLTL